MEPRKRPQGPQMHRGGGRCPSPHPLVGLDGRFRARLGSQQPVQWRLQPHLGQGGALQVKTVLRGPQRCPTMSARRPARASHAANMATAVHASPSSRPSNALSNCLRHLAGPPTPRPWKNQCTSSPGPANPGPALRAAARPRPSSFALRYRPPWRAAPAPWRPYAKRWPPAWQGDDEARHSPRRACPRLGHD